MAIFKLLFGIIWNKKNNRPISMEASMVFSMAAEKTSDKKDSAKEERRSKVDRRRFSYTEYIPERRSERDRRKGENEEGDAEEDKSTE
jgi:FtsZ-interacting cell division protein ZipA